MNNSGFQEDSKSTNRVLPPAGEDLLPPVEAPSAGFIIQLFVVPALIVIVIVGVWLTFNWLVLSTVRTPERLIQGLEQGPNIARWQKASELADLLRNERFAEFKRSGDAADQLAGILDREIARAGGAMQEGDVTLRYFLTRALGEFEVPNGIDVLLKAAETNRDPGEQIVRNGALEAIAVRAYNLRQLEPSQTLEHPELEPTLIRLAGDEDPQIRLKTAYALGQIGTPAAIEQLELMVDDPDDDTRYNAAVGLAHRGKDAGIETLAEMLDLEELASDRDGKTTEASAARRAVLVHTAIEAARALAKQKPDADLSLVIAELEQIADADSETLKNAQLPSRVVAEARGALEALR